ncbi:F0F1 ATP synthase subunit B [Aerococcaceae bacterium DSM 111176]|nr:F0F1 ATP synthase subunit B [Aerococcaceae bacterium DSM 111176]
MLFSPTSLGNALMTVIAFLILFYILYRFAFTPIMKVLDERKAIIESDLEEGATAKSEGQAMVIEANQLMTQARTSSAQMVQDAKNQALEEKQQIMHEAELEINEMKEKAKQSFEQERVLLHQQMEKDTVELAIELTKKLVEREVTADEHQEMIGQFIERLEANAK